MRSLSQKFILKLLPFFMRTLHQSIHYVESLAWVGFSEKVVKSALDDLVVHGILVANAGLTTIGYAYTQDQKIIQKVARLLRPGLCNRSGE